MQTEVFFFLKKKKVVDSECLGFWTMSEKGQEGNGSTHLEMMIVMLLRLVSMRLRLAMKLLLLLRMTSTVLHKYATVHDHFNLMRQPIPTPLICALIWMLRVRVQLWIRIDLA